MDHDFKEFIEQHRDVPEDLRRRSLAYAAVALRGQKVVLKFYLLNFLGALSTLSVCPQYGVGPLGGQSGLVHQIMNLGPVWCGIFCSIIFFTGGNLLAFFVMKDPERKWILNHDSAVITPYVAIIFFLGMLTRSVVQGHIHHDVPSYYAAWVTTAVVFLVLIFTGLRRVKI